MPRFLAVAVAALIAFGAAWGIGGLTGSSEAGELEAERAQKVDVPTQELTTYEAGAAIPALRRERKPRRRKTAARSGGGSTTSPSSTGTGTQQQTNTTRQSPTTPTPRQPSPQPTPGKPDPDKCYDCGGQGGSGGTE